MLERSEASQKKRKEEISPIVEMTKHTSCHLESH